MTLWLVLGQKFENSGFGLRPWADRSYFQSWYPLHEWNARFSDDISWGWAWNSMPGPLFLSDGGGGVPRAIFLFRYCFFTLYQNMKKLQIGCQMLENWTPKALQMWACFFVFQFSRQVVFDWPYVVFAWFSIFSRSRRRLKVDRKRYLYKSTYNVNICCQSA